MNRIKIATPILSGFAPVTRKSNIRLLQNPNPFTSLYSFALIAGSLSASICVDLRINLFPPDLCALFFLCGL